MEIVLLRFIAVWLMLHVVLYFVERYRFKHSNWSWYGFKHNGMLVITYIVWAIDRILIMLAVGCGIVYWIFQPIFPK